MASTTLYNLDVGDPRRVIGGRSSQVGPFRLELAEDYINAVNQLHKPDQLKVTLAGPIDKLTRNVTRVEGVDGGWQVTATATADDDNLTTSVLGRFPSQDGGIRDLCEILTFLTGRRVVLEQALQFFTPNAKSEAACLPEETFAAASIAWSYRERFSSHGLAYALLLENAAIDHRLMQIRAYLHNAVLNILVDKWPSDEIAAVPAPAVTKITKNIRKELADLVEATVVAFPSLPKEAKDAYIPLLRGKVFQGTSSLHDAVLRLLQYDLGILPVNIDQRVLQRVQFVNRVRNFMTHSGQMPDLPGLEQEVADRYTAVIVAGVVPAINQLAIGKLFGFTTETVGSLSQQSADLSRFFLEGNWRGQPLELMSFEEWINSPELLI